MQLGKYRLYKSSKFSGRVIKNCQCVKFMIQGSPPFISLRERPSTNKVDRKMGQTVEPAATYLINEVSRQVELSQKRIREYEKAGLIKPAREPRTNNRRYSGQDIRLISRIKELIHIHGFTVTCLRYFLASAPCWIIFNCTEKDACPAYNTPHTPCYKVFKKNPGRCRLKSCQNCPVYLNRNVPRMALLEKV